MDFPYLKGVNIKQEVTDKFYGYDHNIKPFSGWFYDEKNMSSDRFPMLSPRKKRGYYDGSGYTGVLCGDKVCATVGAYFLIDGNAVSGLELNPLVTASERQLVAMGSYVIILPEKKYVNTVDPTDYGDIDAVVASVDEVTITLSMYDMDQQRVFPSGDVYYGNSYPAEPPEPGEEEEEPEEWPVGGALWVDLSGVVPVMKRYISSSQSWVTVSDTYIKINASGLGSAFSAFNEGDCIKLEDYTQNNSLGYIPTSNVLEKKGQNYIVVHGILRMNSTPGIVREGFNVSRRMPKVDFLIESNNRLWGCKYGEDDDGNFVNEIYACKLGDFKNWNYFAGTAADSYAVSVGSDGDFTGAVTYLGYPMFFKEKCVHKIYGNMPSNYQLQTTALDGVQKGSGRSLVIMDGALYYKSPTQICRYDGGLPVGISKAFGTEKYWYAVAGGNKNKYYVSMKDRDNNYVLMVYDAVKGIWHKEDDTRALAFSKYGDLLIFIDGNGKITAIDPEGSILSMGTLEGDIEWYAETGLIGTDAPGSKYISKLTIRLGITLGCRVTVSVQYDSEPIWRELASIAGHRTQSVSLPVKPRRCDHLRVKISGVGDAYIYSIAKSVEYCSEV